MSKYQYTERDVPAMLGRRGFLKVIGLCAVLVPRRRCDHSADHFPQ